MSYCIVSVLKFSKRRLNEPSTKTVNAAIKVILLFLELKIIHFIGLHKIILKIS